MPVIINKADVSLEGVCTIEDAEPLLQWLQAHPDGKVQLKDCSHLHTALLQILLTGHVQYQNLPSVSGLRVWIEALQLARDDLFLGAKQIV